MTHRSIRPAAAADLVALQALIQRAYRGADSRGGWTHEADLIPTGDRITVAELRAMLDDPGERLMIDWDDARPIGCVRVATVATVAADLAYLGLLCVDPRRQAAGHGKRLMAAAEAIARDVFGARRIEMTVISVRRELIDYYIRRGYAPTGETRPFPVALDPPLTLAVLEKPLA